MADHRIFNKTDTTCIAGKCWDRNCLPFRIPEFISVFCWCLCCSFYSMSCLRVISSVLWRSLPFSCKHDVRFVLISICIVEVHVCWCYLYFFEYCSPTQFPYQMMFVSSSSNTMGATRRCLPFQGTWCSGIRVAQIVKIFNLGLIGKILKFNHLGQFNVVVFC